MHDQMLPRQEVLNQLKRNLEDNERGKSITRIYRALRPIGITFCSFLIVTLVVFLVLINPSLKVDPNHNSNSNNSNNSSSNSNNPSPIQNTYSTFSKAIYHNVQLPDFEFGDNIDRPFGCFFKEQLITMMNEHNNDNYAWVDSNSGHPLPIPEQYLPSGDYTITYEELKGDPNNSSEHTANPARTLATEINYIYFDPTTLKVDKVFKFYCFSSNDLNIGMSDKTDQVTWDNNDNNINIQMPYIELPNSHTNVPLIQSIIYQKSNDIIAMEAQTDLVYDVGDKKNSINQDQTMDKYQKTINELQNMMAGAVENELETGASTDSNNEDRSFNESTAIANVIAEHPDFPSNPLITLLKTLPSGGPKGFIQHVKFTTKAEKITNSEYNVTLTKDWGFTFGSTYVKSIWKYRVTKGGIKLIESIDKDQYPQIMK